MRTILCPICKKPGYIVKEKPRKKNVTLTRRGYYKANNIPYPKEKARNCGWSPHKDYVSSKRTRSEYFRIKHNYKDVIKDIKSGRPKIGWKTRPCYIGSPKAIIRQLELILEKPPKHKLHHRVIEWFQCLEKRIDDILSKTEISESEIEFLANLKRKGDRPNTLRDAIQRWLDKAEQDIANKSKENSDKNVKKHRVKSKREIIDRMNFDDLSFEVTDLTL